MMVVPRTKWRVAALPLSLRAVFEGVMENDLNSLRRRIVRIWRRPPTLATGGEQARTAAGSGPVRRGQGGVEEENMLERTATGAGRGGGKKP